jgi:hypothetical protein
MKFDNNMIVFGKFTDGSLANSPYIQVMYSNGDFYAG